MKLELDLEASSTTEISPSASKRAQLKAVIGASLGTMFEWYDFYLYGSLATFFSVLFFPKGNSTAGLLAALATYGAGFLVRPLGAAVFGSLGDRVGRKKTFLVTIVIMGFSTAGVAFLPTFEQAGWLAPVTLVALRLIQGLAIGGEYGGAAIYVGEISHPSKRGYSTSWIQTTSTAGLIMSLIVILLCRRFTSASEFALWGWRIPFAASVVILAISIYIRSKLDESPVFKQMLDQGKISRRPVREAFSSHKNRKWIMVAIALTCGAAAHWTVSQFYSIFFLTGTLRLDYSYAYPLLLIALVLGAPFYVVFGFLSDKFGRKRIMLAGLAMATFTTLPIYHSLAIAANPLLTSFQAEHHIEVHAAKESCNLNFFAKPSSSCDLFRDFLNRNGLSYALVDEEPGTTSTLAVDGHSSLGDSSPQQITDFLKTFGYPEKADPQKVQSLKVVGLIVILLVYAGAIVGPMAAMLIELFPSNIRYTSVSIAYNVATALFGGSLAFVVSAIQFYTGDIFRGFLFPIACSGLAGFITLFFLPETKDRDIRQ